MVVIVVIVVMVVMGVMVLEKKQTNMKPTNWALTPPINVNPINPPAMEQALIN